MVDKADVHESYEKFKSSDIGLVRSEHNAADAFTKVKKCIVLERRLSDGKIDHLIDELVLRLGVWHSRDSEYGDCRSYVQEFYNAKRAQAERMEERGSGWMMVAEMAKSQSSWWLMGEVVDGLHS